MTNWAELKPKVLHLICNRVGSFVDLVAFGGVCSTWRNVAVQQNLSKPLLPFPCLMLAEHKHDDTRDFYSITEDKTYSFELPGLRGKKCMETKGWIVTVSTKGEMDLVNPISCVKIPLPHQNTSECYYEHPMDPLIFVQRVVLSSPPKPNTESDCVIMILHGGMGHIGFCKLGDKKWTVIENKRKCGNQSLEYYRGKFYVVDNVGEVWECDVIGKSIKTDPITPRKIGVNFNPYMNCTQSYIVKYADSLLVVIRDHLQPKNTVSSEFWVLEIDVERGGYKEVRSLGTRSIFLGHSATLSVDSIWYPELIPSSIYFTDDCIEAYLREDRDEGGGTNMGVYMLGDRSVLPLRSNRSLSFVCPPVWTFLTRR